MPVSIHSIADPPNGSKIRLQRLEESVVLFGMEPASEYGALRSDTTL